MRLDAAAFCFSRSARDVLARGNQRTPRATSAPCLWSIPTGKKLANRHPIQTGNDPDMPKPNAMTRPHITLRRTGSLVRVRA